MYAGRTEGSGLLSQVSAVGPYPSTGYPSLPAALPSTALISGFPVPVAQPNEMLTLLETRQQSTEIKMQLGRVLDGVERISRQLELGPDPGTGTGPIRPMPGIYPFMSAYHFSMPMPYSGGDSMPQPSMANSLPIQFQENSTTGNSPTQVNTAILAIQRILAHNEQLSRELLEKKQIEKDQQAQRFLT